MATTTVTKADTWYTASYQFSQSIGGSFPIDSTVQLSFDVGGSNYTGLKQSVYLGYSLTGSAYTNFYSSSFTIGTTTAQKNFNAVLPHPADDIEFQVSGTINKMGVLQSGSTNIFNAVDVQYDNVSMTVTQPRVEVKQDGILIYQSPSRYILMSKTEGLVIKGGDVEADNLTANTSITVEQDAYVNNVLYADTICTNTTNSVCFPSCNIGIGTDTTIARLTIVAPTVAASSNKSAVPLFSMIGAFGALGFTDDSAGTGSYAEVVLGGGAIPSAGSVHIGGQGGYYIFSGGTGGDGADGSGATVPGVGGSGGYLKLSSGIGGRGGASDDSAVAGATGGQGGYFFIEAGRGGTGGDSDYNGTADGGPGGTGGDIFVLAGLGGGGGRGLGSAVAGTPGTSGSVLIGNQRIQPITWSNTYRVPYRVGIFNGGMYVHTGSFHINDGQIGIGTAIYATQSIQMVGGGVNGQPYTFIMMQNNGGTTAGTSCEIKFKNSSTGPFIDMYGGAVLRAERRSNSADFVWFSTTSLGGGATTLNERFRIFGALNGTMPAGGVGIGTTSWTGGHQLYVAGSIGASGAITPSTPSDLRYKENISQLRNPLQKVIQLRGVEFDWKNNTPHGIPFTGHDVGLVAQEVEKVFPEAVIEMGMEEKYKGIRYDRLIPLLIEAIKEQNEKINKLEKEVKELKGEV